MLRRPLALVSLVVAAVLAAPGGPLPAAAATPPKTPVATGFGGAVASVDADANLETDVADGTCDREGAGKRTLRAVEQGDEAVARRVDFATAKSLQFSTHRAIVIGEALLVDAAHPLRGVDRAVQGAGNLDVARALTTRTPRSAGSSATAAC